MPSGFSLKPVSNVFRQQQQSSQQTPPPADQQPVSRQDILNLQDALVWPPREMRDVNLTEMEKHRKALNSVWEDPNLDPTSKLMQAALHSQLFAIANKKYFSKGEPGSNFLPPTYQTPPPMTPAQQHERQRDINEGATAQDRRQTHSLLPRYRGSPMSAEKTLIHVPQHRKDEGMKMVMGLKSPQSPITWDSEGKLIDRTGGERGKGKAIEGSNIQDLTSFALNPNPMQNPPKGYSTFRDALRDSGLESFITPMTEEVFRTTERRKEEKAMAKKRRAAELTSTVRRSDNIASPPMTRSRGTTKVDPRKLTYK